MRPPTGPRRASGQKTVVQQSKKRAFEEESDGELDVEMDGGEASFESSEDEAAASDRKRRRKAAAVEEENEGMDFEEVETGSATEDEMTIDDSVRLPHAFAAYSLTTRGTDVPSEFFTASSPRHRLRPLPRVHLSRARGRYLF